MPLLPKPYPDEIVGSIMLRGRRNLGVPLKSFLGWVYQAQGRSSCSFVLEPSLDRVGQLCGLTPKQLLWDHTVFPYVTAFLPKAELRRIEAKLLANRPGSSTAALAQNVVSTSPLRRYCPSCAKEDHKRYGETYWHRVHQLPATMLCGKHELPLTQTAIPMSVRGRTDSLSMPPVLAPGRARSLPVPKYVATSLLASTERALGSHLKEAVDWCSRYRGRAESAGFVHVTGELASATMAEALRDHYGAKLLVDLKCRLAGTSTGSWPALLVRPGSKVTGSAVRHVLLDSFLEVGQMSEERKAALAVRKYTTRDYSELDRAAAARMRQELERAARSAQRLTVRQLLESAHIRAAYVHDRRRFPLCRAVVEAFRHSDQSERQLGGRAYWRERTPSRWGLPSKRSATKAAQQSLRHSAELPT